MQRLTPVLFRRHIWSYYKKHKRILSWREHLTPYRVFVSEVMLQQTQVSRVKQKFEHFVTVFPDFNTLASTKLSLLLSEWQGMGYNRRALYLKHAAEIIVEDYNATLSDDITVLQTLPGIGPATAGSIAAFAYNRPTVFIETNIRRVYLHHFFPDLQRISDKQLLPVVKKTLDRNNPREWYYALMDYGSALPQRSGNANKRSRHYVIQPQFEGSRRQIRGAVLRLLLKHTGLTVSMLSEKLSVDYDTLLPIVEQIEKEGFIVKNGTGYYIQ